MIKTVVKRYHLILSIVMTIAFVIINYIIAIPNPNVILITVIVFLTFTGGFPSGIISGCIVIFYSLLFFSDAGKLFHYATINLEKVIVIVTFIPILIILVGILKLRVETKTKELESALKQLEWHSKMDYLTEVPNRRFFDEYFIDEYENSVDLGVKMVCAIVDIDFFKQYNDSYGHISGDRCLRTIANTIQKIAQQTDGFLARFGGEEFVLLWSQIDENAALKICQDIVSAVEKSRIPHDRSSVSSYVTVSIGVSIEAKNQDKMKLLEYADKALYRAKSQGRNQVSLYK